MRTCKFKILSKTSRRVDASVTECHNIIMYTLYVGSPNETHEINDSTLKAIKAMVSKNFESYTYIKARGVYKDTEEDTVLITIANANPDDIYRLGEKLRAFLKQDGVAIEHNGIYERMITK